MSAQIQKLESLLARIQRNAEKPRPARALAPTPVPVHTQELAAATAVPIEPVEAPVAAPVVSRAVDSQPLTAPDPAQLAQQSARVPTLPPAAMEEEVLELEELGPADADDADVVVSVAEEAVVAEVAAAEEVDEAQPPTRRPAEEEPAEAPPSSGRHLVAAPHESARMAVAAPLAEVPEVTLEPAEHFTPAPQDHDTAEPVDLDLDEHAVPPESSKSLRAVPEAPAEHLDAQAAEPAEVAPIDLELEAAPIEVSLDASAADALLDAPSLEVAPVDEPAPLELASGEVSHVQDVVAVEPAVELAAAPAVELAGEPAGEPAGIELSLDAAPELQLQPVADAVAEASEPPVADAAAIEVAAPEEAAIEAPLDEPTFVDGHIPDAPPTPLEGAPIPRFESPPQTPKRVAPAFVVPEPERPIDTGAVALSEPTAQDDASPDTLAPAAATVVAKVATAVALVGAPQGRFEPVAVTIEAAVIRPDVTPADVAAFVGAVRGARPTTFGDVLDAALDL
ncbi:MAG: hypothetical protein JNL79_25550 [Myxococcales bacterium]|nr:hypothetical protein [Myxococcales bacterium]